MLVSNGKEWHPEFDPRFFMYTFIKKKKKTQRNYYKTTLYPSLISSTKQVSAVCVELGGVGTGCFTKKYAQIKS